jgi:hypothetical protein
MSRIDGIFVRVEDHPIVTHCFLTLDFDGELLVEFYIDDTTFLHIIHQETLSLYEHPELLDLHDKHGWNLPELQMFVAGSVSNFGELIPTTTLTTHD